MRIGVLGSGNVGKSLATGFVPRPRVRIGSRSAQVEDRPSGIEGARGLESLCLLWVFAGLSRGDFGHAFPLLTR